MNAAREKHLKKLGLRGSRAELFLQMLTHITTTLQYCSPNGNGTLYQITEVLECLHEALQRLHQWKASTCHLCLDVLVYKGEWIECIFLHTTIFKMNSW